MAELKLLVLQMAVILVAARLTPAAFRFADQPGVVGEMAAGILLGPSLLGRISPAAMNALFPARSVIGVSQTVSLRRCCAAQLWPGLFIRAWETVRPSCRSCCFWERFCRAANLAGIIMPKGGRRADRTSAPQDQKIASSPPG